MKTAERWNMYQEVQSLKSLGLKVSQIARRLGVDRRTIKRYFDAEPEDINDINEKSKSRRKKLDHYKDIILSWLKSFPDLSAAQVYDWLIEKHQIQNVSESTVRNYVRMLRKEHNIPRAVLKRQYEAIEDPPMGQQLQVDFGEKSLLGANGQWIKLRFIVFVLSNSRYKYFEWLDRPFTTADVVKAHENAFEFFGGMTKEIVYDQDHLILVSENHGDLIYTQEFSNYLKLRSFKIYMCRKKDPESKGRVENAVGYVKKNFAHNRTFHNLDKLNEQSIQWLKRTGNGKKHNTTKKIPAEVFIEEKKHLTPVRQKINIPNISKPSITATVRKDNTILYKGNRYSLPLGTYKDKQVNKVILIKKDDNLIIVDKETGEKLAEHEISLEKGKLIKNNNHSRDRSIGIKKYIEEVSVLLGGTIEAKEFLETIYSLKRRYIRDQLQLIKASIDEDNTITQEALDYCLNNKLFSASEFRDAVDHFNRLNNSLIKTTIEENETIELLHEADRGKMKTKPEVRSIDLYTEILSGERKS